MGSSHPAPRKVVATTGTAVVVPPTKLTADDVAAVVAGQGAAYTPYTDAIIKCRMDGKALRGFNDTQLEVKLRGTIGVADPVHMATLLFILPVLRSLTAPSSSFTTADADALNDKREQLDILMLAGNTLFQQNMLSAARAVYERTLVGYERTIGPDHASTIGLVNNLGVLAVAQRRPNDACTLFTRALAGREQLFGPSHALTLGTCQVTHESRLIPRFAPLPCFCVLFTPNTPRTLLPLRQMLANLHLAQQRRDNALDLYIRCYHGYVIRVEARLRVRNKVMLSTRVRIRVRFSMVAHYRGKPHSILSLPHIVIAPTHSFVALHGQEHTAAVTCLKSAETICRQHLHLSAALKKVHQQHAEQTTLC